MPWPQEPPPVHPTASAVLCGRRTSIPSTPHLHSSMLWPPCNSILYVHCPRTIQLALESSLARYSLRTRTLLSPRQCSRCFSPLVCLRRDLFFRKSTLPLCCTLASVFYSLLAARVCVLLLPQEYSTLVTSGFYSRRRFQQPAARVLYSLLSLFQQLTPMASVLSSGRPSTPNALVLLSALSKTLGTSALYPCSTAFGTLAPPLLSNPTTNHHFESLRCASGV